jgi:transcriptional regulator with XRE-family HTH domain
VENLEDHNNSVLRSLGYHLRQIRQQKQLRQKTVAKLCEMDSGSYSNIENGKRNITVLTLFKISKALKVSMAEIISFEMRY